MHGYQRHETIDNYLDKKHGSLNLESHLLGYAFCLEKNVFLIALNERDIDQRILYFSGPIKVKLVDYHDCLRIIRDDTK
jgi:hypothetical protein